MGIIKPTTDIKKFKEGNFVHWLFADNEPSYAVVTEVGNEDIEIAYFENGFPRIEAQTPEYGMVRVATMDEALLHFGGLASRLRRQAEDELFYERPLHSAFVSRQKHALKGFISKLRQGENPSKVMKEPPRQPNTGIFVAMGLYHGHGASKYLEGLKAKPGISEIELSDLLGKRYPKGFGRIPSEVKNTIPTSHGSFASYSVLEVPKEAVDCVWRPKVIKY